MLHKGNFGPSPCLISQQLENMLNLVPGMALAGMRENCFLRRWMVPPFPVLILALMKLENKALSSEPTTCPLEFHPKSYRNCMQAKVLCGITSTDIQQLH
jgi:hypothetical protein